MIFVDSNINITVELYKAYYGSLIHNVVRSPKYKYNKDSVVCVYSAHTLCGQYTCVYLKDIGVNVYAIIQQDSDVITTRLHNIKNYATCDEIDND